MNGILSIIPVEWMAGAAVAFVALAATWFGGRKSAKADAKIKQLQNEVKAHEIRNEVDNRIAAAGNAHKRLRDDWGR